MPGEGFEKVASCPLILFFTPLFQLPLEVQLQQIRGLDQQLQCDFRILRALLQGQGSLDEREYEALPQPLLLIGQVHGEEIPLPKTGMEPDQPA